MKYSFSTGKDGKLASNKPENDLHTSVEQPHQYFASPCQIVDEPLEAEAQDGGTDTPCSPPLNQLQYLQGTFSSLTEVIDILRVATSLKVCHISLTPQPEDRNPERKATAVLPDLSELRLDGDDTLLRFLKTPALKVLRLPGSKNYREIAGMLERSSCVLESLEVGCMDARSGGFIALLKSTPSLLKLSLWSLDRISPIFAAKFANPGSSSEALVPNLTRLEVSHVGVHGGARLIWALKARGPRINSCVVERDGEGMKFKSVGIHTTINFECDRCGGVFAAYDTTDWVENTAYLKRPSSCTGEICLCQWDENYFRRILFGQSRSLTLA
ncbi:hypothetical protein HGRIS_003063 [Hohenbuehelia grisea]|uniref:Uncharacterized protein n=1 Tax=Hohenbuehelia grisea TaxID=104357 RepID=A0ABR3JNT4_9AGAR